MPRRAALAIVLAGAIVAPLDTAVNVAFPAITEAFALELPAIRWIVILYMLTYGGFMLIGGRLGDLYGYRRVFALGLAIVAAAFAACALAPSYAVLIAARIAQGVGMALILGCGPALALSLYEDTARTRVLGAYASMFALGTALGPLLGGALVGPFGWQAVFWMRVPLALAVLVLLRYVPAAPQAADRAFDTPGAALLASWTGTLVLALALPGSASLWLALAALVAFVGFVARASRIPEPILRPALFRDARFTILNLLNIAVNLAAFAVLLLAPYYFVRVAGLGAPGVGLLLGVWAGGTLAGAALAERLGRRFGLQRIGSVGIVLCVVGLGFPGFWDAHTGLFSAGLALFVQGFGVGLFQVAYADGVVAALPREDRGVAGSLTMLTRMLGIVGGATLFAALFRDAEADALSAGLSAPEAFLEGYRFAFRCAAAGLAACFAAEKVSGTFSHGKGS
ncbi:MAG: MFS transporter [Burkholderiales bacterium]|nr:MFS transporter [Burkholderiales bacterium]